MCVKKFTCSIFIEVIAVYLRWVFTTISDPDLIVKEIDVLKNFIIENPKGWGPNYPYKQP